MIATVINVKTFTTKRGGSRMKNRYRVYGHTTVTVTIEVTAETEAEAYEAALNDLTSLNAYGGNGGTDKLVGVDGKDETVNADEEITYDDIELLGPAEDDDDEDENVAGRLEDAE